MGYGLKIYNTAGVAKILSPDDGTVIASGSVTMSNSLNGDNTYGIDIPLNNTYNEDEISVLVVPRRPIYNVNYNQYIDTGTLNYNTFYLNSAKTYYTRNDSTGVMTSYTAGSKTVNQKNTWNPVLSVFPVAFWDKMGATTFDTVRLFGATGYTFRDTGDDVNYSLGETATGAVTAGTTVGTPAKINDDSEAGGGYGAYVFVVIGNSGSYNYWAQVLFNSTNITIAEIVAWEQCTAGNPSSESWAIWYVKLYYNSGWNTVMTGNYSDEYQATPITHTQTGYWPNVTGIRIESNGWAETGDTAIADHETIELRAYGQANDNDTENKVAYSIGDNGVDIVDYMICRKRFT